MMNDVKWTLKDSPRKDGRQWYKQGSEIIGDRSNPSKNEQSWNMAYG